MEIEKFKIGPLGISNDAGPFFKLNLPEDLTEFACPGCQEILIKVPRGKTKLALQAEVVGLRRANERALAAPLLTRIFGWKKLLSGRAS